MQNVAPSRSLARRSRNLLIGAVVVALVGLLSAGIGLFLFAVPLVVPSNPTFNLYELVRQALVAVGLLLFVVALAMAIRAITWKQDNTLSTSVADELANYVDKRYVFIRNISKRALGYVDAVLVGPAGVLVFRITSREGNYYNEGTKWMIQRDKGAWRTLSWSPSEEAIDDIKRMREFLQSNGIEKPQVFGVVVFTQEPPDYDTHVTAQNPVIPVAQLSTLYDRLLPNYLATQDRHDPATVTQIAKLIFE